MLLAGDLRFRDVRVAGVMGGGSSLSRIVGMPVCCCWFGSCIGAEMVATLDWYISLGFAAR